MTSCGSNSSIHEHEKKQQHTSESLNHPGDDNIMSVEKDEDYEEYSYYDDDNNSIPEYITIEISQGHSNKRKRSDSNIAAKSSSSLDRGTNGGGADRELELQRSNSNEAFNANERIEYIRYQMLGAPTLLYRHEHAYLDHSHRPITLTPHQISMALSMNGHPIKDWFTSDKKRQQKHYHTIRKRSPFLTYMHLPRTARQWERLNTLNNMSAKREEEAVQQTMNDGRIIVGNLHRKNRRRIGSEFLNVDLPLPKKKKKKMSGFNVFCSEYIDQLKQQHNDASTTDGPEHHFQVACNAWKELSEEERNAYILNSTIEADEQSFQRKRKISSKPWRNGKVTKLNTFPQYMKDNPNSSDHATENALNVELSGEETSVYESKANEVNLTKAEEEKLKNKEELASSVGDEDVSEGDGSDLEQNEDEDSRHSSDDDSSSSEPVISSSLYEHNPYEEELIEECECHSDSSDPIEIDLHTPDHFHPFHKEAIEFGFHLEEEDESAFYLEDSMQFDRGMSVQAVSSSFPSCSDASRGSASRKSDIKSSNIINGSKQIDLEEEIMMIIRGLKSSPHETKPLSNVEQHGMNDMQLPIGRGLEDTELNDCNGVGGPAGYGNSLLAIGPCRCLCCERASPTWFIVHPVGEILSRVAISKLHLPQDSPLRVAKDGQEEGQTVDVGGRILQISQSGSSLVPFTSTNQTLFLVIRTCWHCTVVYVKATHSCMQSSQREEDCSINLQMYEGICIDLHAKPQCFLPFHVSCNPNATVSYFTRPSFAILSRDDDSGSCTTIHRVVLIDGKRADIMTHDLSSSLADISLIEFSSTDRMVVWAAARSQKMPPPSHGYFKTRIGTLTGYGHSLFRIDMRSNSSSRVWSPSHAEYLTEGLHSIDGIKTDATKNHVLWVSSSSAGKVWALDVRYKSAKVVVSWSLPSLCDDIGANMPITGQPFGGGVLMSQLVNDSSEHKADDFVKNDHPPVMFSLKKDPNSYAVGLHQFPSAMPRFHTRSLESSGFQEFDDSNGMSYARSTILPLPDVSELIFNTGIATLQCSSKKCLDDTQLHQLGYRTLPTNATFVITMTSLGDMYCHTLLETNAMEGTPATLSKGLPIGTKSIPVPAGNQLKSSPPPIPNCLNITLSNEFPRPSTAITPSVTFKTSDFCSSKAIHMDDMNRYQEPQQPNTLDSTTSDTSSELECEEAPQSPNTLLDSTSDTSSEFEFEEAPRSMYDLSSKTNRADMNKSNHLDSFRVASGNGHRVNLSGIKTQSSIQHTPPRFRVIFSSEEQPNTSSRAPISLHSSHIVVARKKANTNDDNSKRGKFTGVMRYTLEKFNNIYCSYGKSGHKNEHDKSTE